MSSANPDQSHGESRRMIFDEAASRDAAGRIRCCHKSGKRSTLTDWSTSPSQAGRVSSPFPCAAPHLRGYRGATQ